MHRFFHEIIEEMNLILKGNTLDTVIPPLLYTFVQSQWGLWNAVVVSLVLAFIIGVYRLIKKQKWVYTLIGLIVVVIASFSALMANNATNYFLPDIVSNVFFTILIFLSLVFDRPIMAYLSHLSRGWPLEWFSLGSVKPAYREVTWIWFIYFLIRTGIQITLFIVNDIVQYVAITTILGIPGFILILIISYIYGINRLKAYQGPGVDEFLAQKKPPYRGQTRGF